MRIFYVTQSIGDWGGSEIYTRDLIRELKRRGHEVFVFTFSLWDYPDMNMYKVRMFGHHALHKFQMPLHTRKALELARKFRPDIVTSHGSSLMGIVGHFIKKDLKIPHVMLLELISSMNKSVHGKVLFRTEKILIPKLNFDEVIVWTQNMKDKFLIPWGIPESKITVLPAALNLSNYNPKTDSSEITKKYGKHLITCVKTFYPTNVMGLKYIVKAMRIVAEKYPEYRLLMFGDGNAKDDLEKCIKEESMEKFVKLPGGVAPEVYKKVCAATTVGPHSFVYEFSTSVSLLEYMAMGVPCVVTDIGSVREFVEDSTVLVKPEDPVSIARGIIKLIENPKMRKDLSSNARKLVERKYSIKSSVDRIEKMYKELTEK